MKKIIIVLLSFLVSALFMVQEVEARELNENSQTSIDSIVQDNYKDVLKDWKTEGYDDDIVFQGVIEPTLFGFAPKDGMFIADETYLEYLSNNSLPEPSTNQVFMFETSNDIDQSITAQIDIHTKGLYKIGIDYFSNTNTIGQIEIEVKINGESQYYESTQLTLPTFWTTPNTFNVDRYGNDIMPMATQKQTWQHLYFRDATRLYEQAILFKLEEGLNTIEIIRRNGYFKLGQIYVENLENYISYETYLNLHEGPYIEEGIIMFEAENISFKNDISIRYSTDRNPENTPFGLTVSRLNVLDGATFKKSGQAIYYEVDIPKSGYYQITVNAAARKEHTRVFRTVTVNGKVPFMEAERIYFESSGWKKHTLMLNDEPLWFYFESGLNTLGFEVNSAPFREIYNNINEVMRGVNNIAIDIKKLTGNQVDENRDWIITDYLPNLAEDLNAFGDLIKQSYDDFKLISNTKKDADIASGLKAAYKWLYQLADKPNDVPKNINKLTGTTSSVLQRLGLVLPLIIDSPLTLEKIYIHGEAASLPKSNPGFFENIFYEIQRFFASFFSNQYTPKSDPEELTIWVNRSRQYVNLMQQMVDDDFTVQTGIKVNISIMPNEDKLILATSSNSQPDIAMGIAGWRPYDFAIRNSVLDLTEFDDFKEFSKNFNPGAFMQLIYQDGVYGIPETQNFNVLFYRRDILNALQLDVPDTWQDVLDTLPELQRFGMNFYSMLSSSSAFKSFSTTMPFIMQHGGSIYSEDVLSSSLDSEAVIQAMTLMTDLYTVYALPLEVGSFYNQFRYGNIPIGIGDFGMYIQLLHAAPEIAGLWDIAPLPGIDLNGEVNRSYDGASTSAMIFKNSKKQDEAWRFLKWWMSENIQLSYAENLMASFGPEYMWNTANVDAFSQMSIDRTHKEVFLEQWRWVLDTAKTPASYMLEREISNAWNKVVYDGYNVRTAMEDALVLVNKEITRKMKEFDFIDQNGHVLKPYLLPTKDNLGNWVYVND